MQASAAATSTSSAGAALRSLALNAVGIIAVLLVWQIAIVLWRIPPYLMPAPGAVLAAVGSNWKVLSAQTSFTLGAAALGLMISTTFAVVTIVSFFPLLINMTRGLASTDRNTLELLHVYGATKWQQLALVRVRFALPFLFAGLRVAGASSILGAMLSEWITGSPGLGNLILESSEMRETELLWAAVLISVVVALVVFGLTSAGERRVLRWRA